MWSASYSSDTPRNAWRHRLARRGARNGRHDRWLGRLRAGRHGRHQHGAGDSRDHNEESAAPASLHGQIVAHAADTRPPASVKLWSWSPRKRPSSRGTPRTRRGWHGADGSRRDHRLLGRREVDRDGRVRGRGLLLRRQPALGDDPLAGRAVHAHGLEGRARGGRVRRARRQLLRGARGDARRPAREGRHAPGAVPRGRRADAADPLQGDTAPPSARARAAASPTGSRASARRSRGCASGRTS